MLNRALEASKERPLSGFQGNRHVCAPALSHRTTSLLGQGLNRVSPVLPSSEHGTTRARHSTTMAQRQQNSPGAGPSAPGGSQSSTTQEANLNTSLRGPSNHGPTSHVANLESPRLFKLQQFCCKHTARTVPNYSRSKRGRRPREGLGTPFLVTVNR